MTRRDRPAMEPPTAGPPDDGSAGTGNRSLPGKKSEFGRKLQAALSRAKKTMIKHHQAS